MSPAILGSLTALCWGSGEVVAKLVGERLGPVVTLFGMLLLSGLGLGVYAVASGASFVWVPEAAWTLALAGSGTVVGMLLLFAALIRGPMTLASPIAASYPVVNLAIAILQGRDVAPGDWGAFAAVLAGIALTARGADSAGAAAPGRRGVAGTLLLAAGAALGFAFAVEGVQRAEPVFGDVQTLLTARVCGVVLLGLLLLARPGQRQSVSVRLWPPLLAMGTLDLLGYFALLAAADTPRPEIAVVVGAAYCIVPVIFGRFVLRERLAAIQTAGILLILGGILYLAAAH